MVRGGKAVAAWIQEAPARHRIPEVPHACRPAPALARLPQADTAWAELGSRAAAALAEEHFEPDLAIRERAHQAEARARRRPTPLPGQARPAAS